MVIHLWWLADVWVSGYETGGTEQGPGCEVSCMPLRMIRVSYSNDGALLKNFKAVNVLTYNKVFAFCPGPSMWEIWPWELRMSSDCPVPALCPSIRFWKELHFTIGLNTETASCSLKIATYIMAFIFSFTEGQLWIKKSKQGNYWSYWLNGDKNLSVTIAHHSSAFYSHLKHKKIFICNHLSFSHSDKPFPYFYYQNPVKCTKCTWYSEDFMSLSRPTLLQKNRAGCLPRYICTRTGVTRNIFWILPLPNLQLFDQWVAFHYLNWKCPFDKFVHISALLRKGICFEYFLGKAIYWIWKKNFTGQYLSKSKSQEVHILWSKLSLFLALKYN